jgi:hypothetical protein
MAICTLKSAMKETWQEAAMHDKSSRCSCNISMTMATMDTETFKRFYNTQERPLKLVHGRLLRWLVVGTKNGCWIDNFFKIKVVFDTGRVGTTGMTEINNTSLFTRLLDTKNLKPLQGKNLDNTQYHTGCRSGIDWNFRQRAHDLKIFDKTYSVIDHPPSIQETVSDWNDGYPHDVPCLRRFLYAIIIQGRLASATETNMIIDTVCMHPRNVFGWKRTR